MPDPYGYNKVPANAFAAIPDGTPTRPAQVSNANTLGGEAARVREGIGQLYMVEVDLEAIYPNLRSEAASIWVPYGADNYIYESRTPWGQTRSYANIEGPDEGGINGNRWLNKELGYLDFAGACPGNSAPARVIRRGLANESLWFGKNPLTGQYDPLTSFHGELVHQGGFFILTDAISHQTVYYDNSLSHPAGLRGKLKELIPTMGSKGIVTYDANEEVRKVAWADDDGKRESIAFEYEYYDTLAHIGMLMRITQRVHREGQEGIGPYRKVEYEYYGDGQSGGSVNDLKRATVWERYSFQANDFSNEGPPETGVWVKLHENFYRYYKDASGTGFQHGLKYALRAKACERIAANGLNPDTVSDSVLATYADYYFEYDAQRRIVKQGIRGSTESFLYAYLDNPDGPGIADKNTWGVKTVVTQPDGSERRTYTNPTSSGLVSVFEDASENKTADAIERNPVGWESQYAYPNAIESVTEPSEGSTDLTVNYRTEDGLLYLYDYYTSDDPVTGAVKGYPKSRSVVKGSDGTADLLDQVNWNTQTSSNATTYAVRRRTRYLESGMEEPPSVEIVNTYYLDSSGNETIQIEKQVSYLPVIPVDQNGDGLEHEIVRFFDKSGNRTWLKDARGFITHWNYRADGILLQRVDDVNTSLYDEVPEDWTTPAGGGLNLVTDVESDPTGRPLRTLGPWHSAVLHEDDERAVNVRTVEFAVYRDDLGEEWKAQGYATGSTPVYGFETVGSVTITRRDKQKRVTDVITAERDCSCGTLTAIETFPQKRWKSWTKNFYDDWGRLLVRRVYHRVPLIGEGERGEHFYETKYAYDEMGRQVRALSAGGTIDRTVFDSRGYVVSRWVGTNDTGATNSDPTGGGAPGNNMVLTLAREYDHGNPDGNGLLTKETRPVDDDPGHDRVTEFGYDYRSFLLEQKVSDGSHDFLTRFSHNNVGQVLQTDTYHSAAEPGNLTGRSVVHLDTIGRVYQTDTYAVDPDTGTVGHALYGELWLDPNGNILKRVAAGSEAFSKTHYDGLNRTIANYLCYNPGTSSNDGNVADDTVVEQTLSAYDSASNRVQTTTFQRFHDATGTGPLQGPNGDQPRARRTYSASWHDGINRIIATGDFGTNGGAAWQRPSAVPERNPTALISSSRYAADGQANAAIDPMGVETRWENNALGRRVLLIENFDPKEPVQDYGANRTTGFSYTPDGQMKSLTLVNALTGDQVTRWIYGTTLEDSGVARADLLRAKIYPESNDEYDPLGDGPLGIYERIEYQYNRQGNIVSMKDPNSTVHAYDYDKMGRQIHDRIISFGVGIDDTIKRLTTAYDSKRLLTAAVSSYNDATVGMGYIVNQVAYTYDGFGQLSADRQSLGGPVDIHTLQVGYGYADGSSGNTARRTSLTYPTGRQVDYSYGEANSPNDLLSRMGSFKINGESTDLVTYTYVGYSRYIRIAYPQPGVELSYVSPSGAPAGDAGDPYSGYDRFGRTVDMRWIASSDGAIKDRIQYGYDMSGNRTWRKNLAAPDGGQDFAYRYDGLSQVTGSALGTLNLNQTAIGGIPAQEESFGYDATGNWLQYQRNDNGIVALNQTRKSNKDNELIQIDGSSTGFDYDLAGNAVKVVPTVDGNWEQSYRLIWDGWNRLVTVKNDAEETQASYAYDALSRRISRKTWNDDEVLYSYYSDRWQCLEVRQGVYTRQQYVWGARPGHRDEMVLQDRDIYGGGTLDERLYALMEYFNPTSMVDTSGDVVERYRFSAFGVRSVMAADWSPLWGSAHGVVFGFQGQFRDAETGWYDYGYRYYLPQLGRWINRDPIGEKGGLNLYVFVDNGSINNIDRFGLTKCCIEEARAARASWRSLMGFNFGAFSSMSGGAIKGIVGGIIFGGFVSEEYETLKALVDDYLNCVANISDPCLECPDGIADDPRNLEWSPD